LSLKINHHEYDVHEDCEIIHHLNPINTVTLDFNKKSECVCMCGPKKHFWKYFESRKITFFLFPIEDHKRNEISKKKKLVMEISFFLRHHTLCFRISTLLFRQKSPKSNFSFITSLLFTVETWNKIVCIFSEYNSLFAKAARDDLIFATDLTDFQLSIELE
jgi:hypothetical protein